jgi:hypothetical protein
MNYLVPSSGNGTSLNPYAEFAQNIADSVIVGRMLRFVKGEYIAGRQPSQEQIESGTEVVVGVDTLEHGWIKWDSENRLVDQVMGTIAEGFKAPQRHELDDNDKDQWEPSANGIRTDPWHRTVRVVMYDKARGESDGLFTFVTSSSGGRRAFKDLYNQVARHPTENPIVKLEVDYYKHKEHGRMAVPKFTIVGWEAK